MFVKLFSEGIVVPRPKELLATTIGYAPATSRSAPKKVGEAATLQPPPPSNRNFKKIS